MPSRDLSYVLDILNAARLVQTFMSGVDLKFPGVKSQGCVMFLSIPMMA